MGGAFLINMMKVHTGFYLQVKENERVVDVVYYQPGDKVKDEHIDCVPKHLIELGCVDKPKKKTVRTSTKNAAPKTEDK